MVLPSLTGMNSNIYISQNISFTNLNGHVLYAYDCCQNARLWPDETGKAWKMSLKNLGYQVLLVSQFTLHGHFSGNKPDFHLSSTASVVSRYSVVAIGGSDS